MHAFWMQASAAVAVIISQSQFVELSLFKKQFLATPTQNSPCFLGNTYQLVLSLSSMAEVRYSRFSNAFANNFLETLKYRNSGCYE